MICLWNKTLPFLDVLVKIKPDDTLGYHVYRKLNHTSRYLNTDSHHHPIQKQGVLNTLIYRVRIICEQAHLEEELGHLRTECKCMKNTSRNIKKAIKRNAYPKKKQVQIRTFNSWKVVQVSRVLKAFWKIGNIREGLQDPGIYSIPCTCGKIHIG